MKSPKEIFKSHPSPSQEEISSYLEGKLSAADQNRIEQKIAHDEFSTDAFEGIEQNPSAWQSFDDVKQKMHQQIQKKQKFWKFHYTLILVGSLALGVTLIAPYIFSDKDQPFFDRSTVKPSQKVIEDPIVTQLSDEEIDDSEYIELIDMILPEVVISASPVVMNDKYKIEPLVVTSEFEKALEIKKIDDPKINAIELPTIDDIVYTNVSTFYVEKFLMVDYSTIYTEQIPVQVTEYSGTPANLESADKAHTSLVEPKVTTKFVTYKSYLFETQELFAIGNFKAALKRYNVILSHYPNDLNAHFYGGLCYYNLKQPQKALEHFEVAQKHQYNTFKIDAEWYTAKVYKLMKENDKCKQVLEKIIKDNDYYAKQASELLKKMNP
jgi:tetratricopeptide (TPR) repeat protein